MLDTQKKITIILYFFGALIVGFVIWGGITFIRKSAEEAERFRLTNEDAERQRQEFVKALELRDSAKAKDIEQKKINDGSTAEMEKSISKTAMEVDRAMLETVDTTTPEGKQKWAEYKKRTSPY